MKKLITATLALAMAFTAANAAKTSKPAWAPAGDKIKTVWAEQVNPAAPLPEYPRPQMVRSEWVNLNGLWNYAITEAEATSFTPEGEILVPFAVESSLSGVGRTVSPDQALWYSRNFTIPKTWKGRNVVLHFGAIDWASAIYVNGKLVCTHTGGYTPISVDITSALNPKAKTQTLQVKVMDSSDYTYQPRGKQWLVPSGIWYTPVTGIWQTVWMEPVAKAHINKYYAVSDIDAGKIDFQIDAEAQNGDTFVVEVLEGGHGYSAEAPASAVVATASAKAGENVVVSIPDVHTWSYEDPYLYGVRISQLRDGKVVDVVNGYTAMRKVSTVYIQGDVKKLGVNNKPTFQFGPLDQGWWPDGLYTAPTDEALRFDLQKTREWGFNMIRKHIKVEPARWYYWADVEGIYIWQDMPSIGDHGMPAHREPEAARRQHNSWRNDTNVGNTECDIPQEWKDNYYKEWSEIIDAIKCFQCIVSWIPFNEGWGQFDTEKVVAFTRELDPTRLINPASGGCYAPCGDIIDTHHYPAPRLGYYDRAYINVLGEFGGIGRVVPGHVWQQDRNWGYEQFSTPEQVLERYKEMIDVMALLAKLGYSGAIYTQTTDVEGEINGIMTYDRKVIKFDEAKLFEINQSLIKAMPTE